LRDSTGKRNAETVVNFEKALNNKLKDIIEKRSKNAIKWNYNLLKESIFNHLTVNKRGVVRACK
jgi:hypothetical protein